MLLTTLLVPICILASFDAIKKNMKEFMIAFLVLESLVIAAFVILDLLLFYVFFEAVLIPMFIIIKGDHVSERFAQHTYSSCIPCWGRSSCC